MATLALDIGGTKISGLLKTSDKDYIESTLLVKKYHAKTELDEILTFVRILIDNSHERITSCGISSAATISEDGIVTRWPNRNYWRGVPLKSSLQSLLKCSQIFIEDDGNTAALSESRALGINSLIYIGIGTGVGGGIICNGNILKGVNGSAAEIGHMLISPYGPICTCERKGCLQSYASGTAILANAFHGQLDTSHRQLINALSRNDQLAKQAIDIAAEALAIAIINLSEILDPKAVVIGGGMGVGIPDITHCTQDYLSRYAREGQILPETYRAHHGSQSSLFGAMILAEQAGITK